ncbi:YibE/F family protein [Demequina zhanjiangensis]|uniref:YibE/F family protein n=1 Tax=Demequina zhanjiangensis TaxID=3051659 RepID=A0ABT8G063_9MICO|nr:YibE/F family protein [Demequina sp. SYSU T00b26]MDN4472525.1 YibE/F family protein [Demequina sp. SYSU T00b26]
MGAGHTHVELDGPAPRASERASIVLGSCVAAVLFLTIVGAMVVWPSSWDMLGSEPTVDPSSRWVTAEVTSERADGTYGAVIQGEEDAGEVTLLETGDPTLVVEVGDVVRALELPEGELVFSDFERGSPVLLLFVVYALLVVAIARWRGLGALLGLVAAFGIIIFFTTPALLSGGDPLIIGLVTGSGALFVLLYLAHGVNARTTTAYLGTLAGLSITALLAWWAVDASKLTGIWSEEGVHLEFWTRGVSLSGLVLCGIILAGLGVLNDVTITQASALWELRRARPDMSRLELFRRTMRIGRDHIASTVYTIAFAYVGAALPTILFVSLYDQSVGRTLTSADIAEEVVRTLVSSIGLVLAVPLTTAIGAAVVGKDAVVEPMVEKADEDADGSESVDLDGAPDAEEGDARRHGGTSGTMET